MRQASNRRYPLFVPPAPLAEKRAREWSAAEARAYRDRLLGVLEARTDGLLAYFGEAIAGGPEAALDRVGARVASALRRPDFSRVAEAGPGLTDRGHALAADMGLLTARLLPGACPSVRWEIVEAKRHASYNLPVLKGFGGLALDPVGGPIAEAWGILRDERAGDAWRWMFTFWRARAG
jgi:hypothetical protein